MTLRSKSIQTALIRLSLIAGCTITALLFNSRAMRADDWEFRPSFYSHQPNPYLESIAPRPASRSAYRVPYFGAGPGFAIRGGYRYNRVAIQSGNSFDVTIFRQNWFEATP